MFNSIIKQENTTPDSWKKVTMKVIYKKGDPVRPENYRPISTLAPLFIVLSALLYKRLYSRLDIRKPPDWGGFRCSLQTVDHLVTFRMLEQTYKERGLNMWIATVDFAKAFGTIYHEAIWRAVAEIRN